VLVRAGHTEASVDIARLAGLNPSGVICEIMNDDGSMARLPDLVGFAQLHGLKVGTIADLIAYRRRNDNLVTRVVEDRIVSRWGGEFRMIVYRNTVEYAEHIALVKGDLGGDEPVLVRVHALNVIEDVLGDKQGASSGLLHGAMRSIGEAGRGVVVLIREPRPTALSDRVRKRIGEPVERQGELRDYGIGAQILLDLGVRDMVVLSNSVKTIIGIEGYGLNVAEIRPVAAVSD
jgi:3,4-dihydroxy 2-butanone 4-phosphate synthase/GTP cyclohydrolase II